MHFSPIQNFSKRSCHYLVLISWMDHQRRSLCCSIERVQRFHDLKLKRTADYHSTSMMPYRPKSSWVLTVSAISSKSKTSLSLSLAAGESCWKGRWELLLVENHESPQSQRAQEARMCWAVSVEGSTPRWILLANLVWMRQMATGWSSLTAASRWP